MKIFQQDEYVTRVNLIDPNNDLCRALSWGDYRYRQEEGKEDGHPREGDERRSLRETILCYGPDNPAEDEAGDMVEEGKEGVDSVEDFVSMVNRSFTVKNFKKRIQSSLRTVSQSFRRGNYCAPASSIAVPVYGTQISRRQQGAPNRLVTVIRTEYPQAEGNNNVSSASNQRHEMAEHGINLRKERRAKIYLDNCEPSVFRSLASNLSENSRLTDLEVVRSEGQVETKRSPEELIWFFDVIQSRPKLRKVSLRNFTGDDMAIVSEFLYYHPTLLSISIHLLVGAVDQSTTEAIASIENLLEVELEMQESFSLTPLLESKTLQVLRVISQEFKFKNHHILSMASMLQFNTSLTTLDIEPRMSTLALKTLMISLQLNRTIEKVHFSYRTKDVQDGDESLLEIIHALQANSTLRVIWNYNYENVEVSYKYLDRLLTTLERNKNMEQFRFFDEDPEFYKDLAVVLEENYVRRRSEFGLPDCNISFLNCFAPWSDW